MGDDPTTRDWDGATYHRVSAPHVEWAHALLDRLELNGDETVLDAGCGSGRVTAMLLERLPRGRVVAVDAADGMIEQARQNLDDPRVTVLQQDLTRLVLDEPVDAVFSSAVFHWIKDHETLFGRLAAALRPGGRLVVQCGGHGNIDDVRGIARELARGKPYAQHLDPLPEPWNYATPEDTERRMQAAGFTDVRAWLQPWEVQPPEPLTFLGSVCLGPYTDLLPEGLRSAFVEAVAARLGDPRTGRPIRLAYVRLNITASTPR
jgi:trans-aconitate 2-methyltransferase